MGKEKKFSKAGMYFQLRGLRIGEIAKAAKVPPSFISKISYVNEDGYTYIPKHYNAFFWGNLTKVMKALHCRMDDII